MAIIVTQGEMPTPVNGDLLIVEPFNNIGEAQSANRLPVGVYYVQDNTFKNANYRNLADILAKSFKFPTQQPTVIGDVMNVNIVEGSNRIPHNLNQVPDIVQFWQGDDLFVAGFQARANSTEIIVYSSDNYSDINIKMLKF